MRVLYVHETSGFFGGAEANVYATAAALQRRGVTVGLLAQRASGRGTPEWQALFGEHQFLLGEGPLAETLARFAPDVLYVHKWEEPASTEQFLAGSTPLVRMVHDHDLYCLRSYRYHPLTRAVCHRPLGGHCVFPCLAPLKRGSGRLPVQWVSFLEKKHGLAQARRFDLNLVATRYMRDELLLNGFPAERVKICAPVPPPAEPLRSGFTERNLLVYAGQIVRGKGVDVLLRALARVPGRWEAVILGEGGHRAKCERLARKLGLGDRVFFKGFVPPAEMRGYYQEATAVMVPSVWPEPMGLVGLEAMRYALPVVAFEAGGISDWLHDGENGFLVPWMDVERFAARITELLENKDLARAMGERGLARVSRDFSFEPYLDHLQEVLHQAHAAGREGTGTDPGAAPPPSPLPEPALTV